MNEYLEGILWGLDSMRHDIRIIRRILEKEHGSLQLDDLAEKVPNMQQVDKSVGSPAPLGNFEEQE